MDRLAWVGVGAVLGAMVVPWMPLGAEMAGGILAGTLLMGACRRLRSIGALGTGGALAWLAVAWMPLGIVLDGEVVVEGRVEGAVVGSSAMVAVRRWTRPGEPWRLGEGRVWAVMPPAAPPPGAEVLIFGRAGRPAQDALPGEPDAVTNASRSRVRTQLVARQWATVGRDPRADDLARPMSHPLLRALATGRRETLPAEWVTRLRATGTAHLLAISGFHVGLVGLMVGGGARLGLHLVAPVWPRGVSPAVSWAIGALAGVAYAWGAGAPVSAQRAAGLLVLAAVGRSLGRRVDPLALLGVVALGLVLWEPAVVGTPSFQLSFSAVIGLIHVTPVLLRWMPPDVPWLVGWGARGLATTVAATIGTLAPAAWWFQQLAPGSPIANLFAIPWTAAVLVPCALMAGFGPAVSAPVFDAAGTWAADALIEGLGWLEVTPWTPAVGPVGALILGLLPWVFADWRAVVAIGLCGLGLRVIPADRLVVTFLDVGQGDAALVEWPDGRRWLVDGGPPGDRVLRWLRRRGVNFLDVVVVTHGQQDHYGGVLPVLRELDVGEVWLSTAHQGSMPVIREANRSGVPAGVPQAIHPEATFHSDELNDHSLVLALRHGHLGVLLTGDIEAAGEEALLGRIGPVDVMKVPHHGSRTSSSESLLDALQPAIAVLPVGRRNVYRHPSPDVVARYVERDVALYRTDVHGSIEVSLRADEISVRSWMAGAGWSEVSRYVVGLGSEARLVSPMLER